MQRATLLALGLVGLVAFAGCNVFNSGSNTPAVTPMDVPTADPTLTAVPQLAPGLTQYGLTNASALIDAHTAILANTSFTVREVWLLKYPNGTVAARRVSTKRVEDDRVYRTYESTGLLEPAQQEVWIGTKRSFGRITQNNSTSYYRISRARLSHNELIPQPPPAFLDAIASQSNSISKNVTRNGTTVYRLTAMSKNSSSQYAGSILVTASGLIQQFTVRIPISFEPIPNASLSVRSVRITNIGTTTVERPSWYTEAVNATAANRTTATTTTTDERMSGSRRIPLYAATPLVTASNERD